MKRTMRTTRIALVTATLAGTLWGLPQGLLTAAQPLDSSATAQAAGPQAGGAAARLNKKEFREVKVTENHGIVTLTGTVDLYAYKAEADKRVRKTNGVTAVHNLIEVAGPNLPDEVLGTKIVDKLAYDRVFYGNAFNAIDPVSLFDNRIRMQVFRAVYGFPSLNRYAIDPAKPIRISVQNGHVELYGMVDSEGDKNTAFIRANAVPGVFDVKNYLQVADQPAKKQK